MKKLILGLTLLLAGAASAETAVFSSKQIGPKDDRIPVKVYTNQSQYNVGEEMDITIKADRDCYFVLYYVDSTGHAQVVAPSSFSKANKLKKNQAFSVRDTKGRKLEQKGPAGYERLQVLVTTSPIDMKRFTTSMDPDSGEVQNPEVFVADVQSSLKEKLQEKGVGPKAPSAQGLFGIAEITYTVR